MAGVTDRLGRLLERAAPRGDIEPVPTEGRELSGLDMGVLWGDLSVGILVLFTGALLVPAMALPAAIGAIAVGSLLGCLPLAAVAADGARTGRPTMALLRPVLGERGSYVPSAINAVQLIGWAAFEFWAMAGIANAVSRSAFGLDIYGAWLVVIAAVCIALAMAGPVVFVRRWLERFGIFVLLGAGAWLTFRVATSGDLGGAWRAPGLGGLGFWVAVDLVIAMPVSWLPLVADYGRFARSPRAAFVGTYGGYVLGNVWFYALGALLVLVAGSSATVLGIGAALIALGGGAVVLLALLVGETDGAFANLYSTATSVRNIGPILPGRRLTLVAGIAAFALAAVLGESAETFELFLLTIGSVFVPLFGVYFAHRLVRPGPARAWCDPGALTAWVVGFGVYQWSIPSPLPAWSAGVEWFFADLLGAPFPLFGGALGASIPSFVVASALGIVAFGLPRRTRVIRPPRG
ncbi:MAG: cytosine permease [Actinomycetota bacterium]